MIRINLMPFRIRPTEATNWQIILAIGVSIAMTLFGLAIKNIYVWTIFLLVSICSYRFYNLLDSEKVGLIEAFQDEEMRQAIRKAFTKRWIVLWFGIWFICLMRLIH